MLFKTATRLALTAIFILCTSVITHAAGVVFGVRISDLKNMPLPPNPVIVWGKVTSVSPLKLSDGRATITVTGKSASIGEYLVLTGYWSGGTLNIESVSIPGAPSGEANALVNANIPYSTTGSACSQGHPLEYSFNWGDGTSSPWSTSTSASHIWSAPADVSVTVSVRCQLHPTITATSSESAVKVSATPYPGQLIFIPAGAYLMGHNGNEAYPNETNTLPQHSVYLAGFYMGKYEVTRGEYSQFMNAGGYTNPAYWSPQGWVWKATRTEPRFWAALQSWWHAFIQTDNHPVIGITYYEAEAFCNWAGGDLPTEEQWEKAARWDTVTGHPNVRPWGDEWDVQKCNNANDTFYVAEPAPVGSYPSGASPYGCQDMAGNVTEWCQNWFRSYPGSTQPIDYTGTYRPVRDLGFTDSSIDSFRCAYRRVAPPTFSFNSSGFRFSRAGVGSHTVGIPGTPTGYRYPLANESETFTTTGSTCSMGHALEYSFNWGDGTSSPWSIANSASHPFNSAGNINVSVSARCQFHTDITSKSGDLVVAVGGVDPIETINIPAENFLMGNNGSEPASLADELPQHSVYLSAYRIGKQEVSRGQYHAFMNAGGYSNPAYWSTDGWAWKVRVNRTEPQYWGVKSWGSFTQTNSHPVVGVNYYEAEAFCKWAGGHLPTEAQWEKAARWTGTHANIYPWGDTWNDQNCNNQKDTLYYPAFQTVPVGSYKDGASPYGCQDMAGNAYEWCKDWYGDDYYSKSPAGGWTDPQGPISGSWRIIRGGCFTDDNGGSIFRCARRCNVFIESDQYTYGFRIAR